MAFRLPSGFVGIARLAKMHVRIYHARKQQSVRGIAEVVLDVMMVQVVLFVIRINDVLNAVLV